MAEAAGIHDHDRFKTGLKPTDPAKPILTIDAALTGVTPSPSSEDRYAGVMFAMDGNDTFGTCGPTSVDNNRRSTSKVATSAQRSATEAQVFDLYRQSGNPNFNPHDPSTEDNGVEMGAMLDALLANGLGGDKPVAFARSKALDDESLERLVAVFGGVLFAVDLQTAQQAQTDAHPPVWDYKSSGEWGGHAIYCGKYRVEKTPSGLTVLEAPVITWQKEVGTTDAFRTHQLEEAWVIIWPWHLDHPAFLEGVDVAVLAEEYKTLTGKALPVPSPTPTPTPTPTPSTVDQADRELAEATRHWRIDEHHVADNKRAAQAVTKWAKAKGIE